MTGVQAPLLPGWPAPRGRICGNCFHDYIHHCAGQGCGHGSTPADPCPCPGFTPATAPTADATPYPPWALMARPAPPKPGEPFDHRCHGCGQNIRWGYTTTGRIAPFDLAPPHVNHWITCPDKKKRERYK